MRILLVGTEWTPVREGAGGLEHLLLGWARELSGRHDVFVASVGRDDLLTGRPEPGEPFGRVQVDAPAGLEEAVRRLRLDVVQLNNRPAWARRVAPALVTLHNPPAAWADTRWPETGEEVEAALSGAGWVSAVSRHLATRVVTACPAVAGRTSVTYPFAAPVFFEAAEVDGADKEATVLFPNRLLRKKGVEVTLRVARDHPELAAAFVFFDFIAPWSRPTEEHLALRDAVASTPGCRLLPPPPDRAAYARSLARASVVLAPSVEEEGLGLVPVESQAAGTRAVVSDLGGLPETVPDRSWVAPAGDAAALAVLVERALLAPRLEPGVRAWVAGRFSLSRSAEAVERALTAAAGR